MRSILAVVLLFTIAVPLSAAKSRDWKDATLTKVTSSEGPTVVMPLAGGLVGGRIQHTYYVFETPDLVIAGLSPKNSALNLTINKVTKIAIDGQKLYAIDDAGKELKFRIAGKRQK